MQIKNSTFHTPSPLLKHLSEERQALQARLAKDEQALAQNTSKRISEEAKVSLQTGMSQAVKSFKNEPDYDGVKDPLKKAKDEASKDKKAKDQADSLKFQQMDSSVRAHEAAHLAAAGTHSSGGASFSYTKGPDGKLYASAGEVATSLKKGKTPEETIANASSVMAAALAPTDPSTQDLKVVARAARMQAEARSLLIEQNDAKNSKENPKEDGVLNHLKKTNEKALKEYTRTLKPSELSLSA